MLPFYGILLLPVLLLSLISKNIRINWWQQFCKHGNEPPKRGCYYTKHFSETFIQGVTYRHFFRIFTTDTIKRSQIN